MSLSRNAEEELSADEVATFDQLLARVDDLNILKTRARYTLEHVSQLMKAEAFDQKFDQGKEDIVDDLDLPRLRRPGREQRRIDENTKELLSALEIPDAFYSQIQGMALSQSRSINEPIVALLQRALDLETQRQNQAKILQGIHQARWTPSAIAPDSVTLLREIRGYDESPNSLRG